MIDQAIIWDEAATVIQLAREGDRGGPTMIFEGTLIDALRSLRYCDRLELSRRRINLPNSARRPRSYEGPALYKLLQETPPSDFGFSDSP